MASTPITSAADWLAAITPPAGPPVVMPPADSTPNPIDNRVDWAPSPGGACAAGGNRWLANVTGEVAK